MTKGLVDKGLIIKYEKVKKIRKNEWIYWKERKAERGEREKGRDMREGKAGIWIG